MAFSRDWRINMQHNNPDNSNNVNILKFSSVFFGRSHHQQHITRREVKKKRFFLLVFFTFFFCVCS